MRNIRSSPAVLLFASAAITVNAHDVITTKVTWTREISRIVYKRCASCHHEGGSAFSLITYEEARPWAVSIKDEVLERRMPPWGAVKGFGDFRNDEGLTAEEMELITDWVVGGAPQGDPNLAPAPPKFEAKNSPAPGNTGTELVNNSAVLKRDLTVAAIRPEHVKDGATLRVIAQRPDGQLEPLVWLYNYQPRFAQTYYFRTPLRLQAGTRIQIEPEGAGAVSLISQSRYPSGKTGTSKTAVFTTPCRWNCTHTR